MADQVPSARLTPEEQKTITAMLVTEMDEIFYGKNIASGSLEDS